MRLYPDVPRRRLATLVSDLVVLVLLALFAWLGLKVHNVIDELAVLGRGVTDAGNAVQGGFDTAADAVEEAPLVGGDLADGLREAGEGTGGNVAEIGRDGENAAHRTADILGFLTFFIPSVLVLLQALPARVAQIRRLAAANRVLGEPDSSERRRVLAMRAAFSLPYGTLLTYTPDPLGDIVAERYDALVLAAYEDAGLRPR